MFVFAALPPGGVRGAGLARGASRGSGTEILPRSGRAGGRGPRRSANVLITVYLWNLCENCDCLDGKTLADGSAEPNVVTGGVVTFR